jgi:hypothetical protein
MVVLLDIYLAAKLGDKSVEKKVAKKDEMMADLMVAHSVGNLAVH